MNCPVCNKALKTLEYEKQEVDLCPKCGGIWFDKGELLAALNNLTNRNPVSLQTFNEARRNKPVDSDQFQKFIRKCPVCSVDMDLRNYSYDSNIFIDACPQCDGIWTDKGEMQAVAKYVKGNPDMDRYSQALVGLCAKPQKRVDYTGRLIAVIISLFYLGYASYCYGSKGFFGMLSSLILPLACIFFGKEMGNAPNVRFIIPSFAPTERKGTPGAIIIFVGWAMLLIVPLAFQYFVLRYFILRS